MKNILILNYEFPPIWWWWGVSSYDLAQCYNKNWYNVDVITMWFKNVPKYEEYWVNIYRVNCIRKNKTVCYPFEQLTYLISWFFKARKLIKQKHYDLCHCHFLLPTWILSLLLKKLYWLKYIISAHWSDVPWHNPDRFTFIHKFTPRIIRKIINNSDWVYAPSLYLANLIKEKIKWINKDITVIPNWVHINEFVPLKKEKIILWVWRLQPLKWLHLLAKAFFQIKDTKWYELHICWDWPLMFELQNIQQNTNNKIILHWWMNYNLQEYKDLFWKAKIFCLPSVAESWSISLLEWMSAWCIPVWINRTVISEMIEWIWFFIEPTVESIQEQLEYLINNEIDNNIWNKARERVIQKYDKQKHSNLYLQEIKWKLS